MYFDETASPRRWYAVGIVSFGPSKCGQANYAGVYTRYVRKLVFFFTKLSQYTFTFPYDHCEIFQILYFSLELTNISIGY